MNQDEYISKRLNEQITWYDNKTIANKKWYMRSKIVSIVCGAAIPVLTGLVLTWHWLLNVVALLGALITILESMTSLFKWHDNWINYRRIVEQLKHEKYAYVTNAGVYEQANGPFELLVERCENIISSENENWININNQSNGSSVK